MTLSLLRDNNLTIND